MKILSAAQLGTDLPTAASLLKHHELFDMEVTSHSDIVKQVRSDVTRCCDDVTWFIDDVTLCFDDFTLCFHDVTLC